MQYEGKSYWSSSLFYISAQPQYKDENKQKAWGLIHEAFLGLSKHLHVTIVRS